MLPGMLAGMVLSFARAFGEFGATITFVSNIPGETQTLPTAIYVFTQVPGGDAQALRLTLIAVARSEEHTSELQSLMRNSYAVFCLKKQTSLMRRTTATNYLYKHT